MWSGRDAWSHAYQPGEIKNLLEPEAVEYLVQRGIDKRDAQELFQVSCLPEPMSAASLRPH